MSASSRRKGVVGRRKGVVGEREVTRLWRDAGFTVRGLEASGDHLIVRAKRGEGTILGHGDFLEALQLGLVALGWQEEIAHYEVEQLRAVLTPPEPLHLEVKRQERIRLPEWAEQAEREAPPGTIAVVCWRRSRMEWRADLRLDALAELAS